MHWELLQKKQLVASTGSLRTQPDFANTLHEQMQTNDGAPDSCFQALSKSPGVCRHVISIGQLLVCTCASQLVAPVDSWIAGTKRHAMVTWHVQ